eukprot:TRINITY_DN41690_c0_g1_i7.p1 TRINITY_DN41690_c0_g1~~TRINITY_DN41690_c0_g1_i7.p1  ORF type:complete len:182 (+),score=0.50 TRINITY_DN41690_c0_g1_i7:458-1003(+)
MDNNHNYYNLPKNYVYDNCYKRCSMDLIVQKNGRRLVNMCTDNQLYILNGRMLGDLQGKFTCFHPQGCSVVDYIICSQALMKNVKYMKVKELMEHSDHCPVDFEIYIPCIDRVKCKILLKTKMTKYRNNHDECTHQNIVQFSWDVNSREQFQKALKVQTIQSHMIQLKNTYIIYIQVTTVQ